MYTSFWSILLFGSFLQEIVFSAKEVEIFSWNPENGYKTKKNLFKEQWQWEDRRKIMEERPCSQRIYRFLLGWLCLFVGWLILLPLIMNLASSFNDCCSNRYTFNDVLVLILGLVGISGRLPVIIDSVQEWFKR